MCSGGWHKGQEMAMLVAGCSLVHLADAKQSYLLQCTFQWQQVARGCYILNVDLAKKHRERFYHSL